jgi:hypothetical protein
MEIKLGQSNRHNRLKFIGIKPELTEVNRLILVSNTDIGSNEITNHKLQDGSLYSRIGYGSETGLASFDHLRGAARQIVQVLRNNGLVVELNEELNIVDPDEHLFLDRQT